MRSWLIIYGIAVVIWIIFTWLELDWWAMGVFIFMCLVTLVRAIIGIKNSIKEK